jgi:hypothetical protein
MDMIATSVEPVWSDVVESRIVEYRNVYTGDRGTVEDVTFFAYTTARRANDELLHPLRARNIQALVVGDCQSAVAMGPMALVADDLVAGRLVIPFPAE